MLGVACIEECLAAGIEVVALVRPGTKRLSRLPQDKRLAVVECKMDEYASVLLPNDKYDVLFHFAWSSTSHEDRVIPEKQICNITNSIEAVKLAARYRCQRFIGIGSQAEYGPANVPLGPNSPLRPVIAYGVAKNAAQMMCRIECERQGISFLWARVFSVYGPLDNKGTLVEALIDHLEKGETMPLSRCEQIWDYLYSSDCGRAILLIAKYGKDGAVYCVGSGIGRPLREYVNIIADQYGVDMTPCMGLIPYSPTQSMLLQADINTLHDDTGFVPKTEFVMGIKKIIDYKRGQPR